MKIDKQLKNNKINKMPIIKCIHISNMQYWKKNNEKKLKLKKNYSNKSTNTKMKLRKLSAHKKRIIDKKST